MGVHVPEPEEERGPLIAINLLSRDVNSASNTQKKSDTIKGPSNPLSSTMPLVGDAEDEDSDKKPKKPASPKLPICRFHQGRKNGRESVSAIPTSLGPH
jgi:hypothetical protein